MFPKIELHCPYKERLAEAMDGDHCRICSHTVHDLDALDPRARREFLNAPVGGTACVRYRLPAAMAAAALAAGLVASPAAAQQAGGNEQAAVPAAQDDEAEQVIVGSFSRIPLTAQQRRERERAQREERREERRSARRQRSGS